jgi:arylsulfatase A-like enzyme
MIRLFMVACVALCVSSAGFAADARPNILWLTTEDIGPHLGCYGDPAAKTPVLDALAKRGMLFNVAWSNYPVCAPARTTIITGVYPASTGTGYMRCSRPLPKSIRLYPEYLRDAGYYCTNNVKTDYNLPVQKQVWNESSRKASYKNRKPGQPFFAIFNYTGTHESKIRKLPHKVKTDVSKIRLPKYYPDIPAVRRDWGQYYDNIAVMDGWVGRKLAELEKSGEADNTIIFFYGDHGSGMPRHKRYPGDSGLRVPLIVYVPPKLKDLAPKEYKAGGRSDRLAAFIDLAPTVLSLAGVKPPKQMHGHAFMGKYQVVGPKYLYGFRARMDERPDLVRTLRDQRFLYIRNYMPYRPHGQHVWYQFETPTTAKWYALFAAGKLNPVQAAFWKPRAPEELYDLKSDPDETKNLAGNAEFKTVLERFRNELRRHTLAIRDVEFLPEATVETICHREPPYTFGHDPKRYPLAKILAVADIATRRNAASVRALLTAAESKNAAIRYWAATGLLNRGTSVVQKQRRRLRKLLDDASPSVAIVAAEALARYSNDDDKTAALQTLSRYANLKNGSYFAAVSALNAIDNLGDVAKPTYAALAKVPTVDPRVKRAQKYIQRLVQTITKP